MKKIKLLIAIIFVISFALIMPNVKAQQICFEPVVNFAVDSGMHPIGITCADFNNDGKLDLAVALYDTSKIAVMLGSGTGSFSSPTYFNVGTEPQSLISSDFNNDGNMDLAIACVGGYVSVLLGDGIGSFSFAVNYAVSVPESIISADFNNDGFADLATADYFYTISILLGTGTGSFSPVTDYIISDPGHPFGIISSDFNEDSIPDIATVGGSSNNISVFLGTGAGGFGTPTHFLASVAPSIVTADFNGDGHTDLATSHISVLLGDGSGVFGTVTDYSGGGASITCADFNHDGKLDLATVNKMANMVYVLLGTGSGFFISPQSFDVGISPSGITNGDFNGDGKIDIATANILSDNISILLNCTETSINQLYTGKEKITVYPNPANERLRVKTGNNSRMFRVSMYDMLGNKIISTKEKEIDIRTLQNGIYLVKVETGKSVQTKKIVIQK